MNTSLKKVFIVLGATIALGGCSLTQLFSSKQTSPVKESSTSPTVSTQVEASPTSQSESPSYKMENTTPVVAPAPTTSKNDDPETLQKDLDSVKIENDFGALVK